MVSPVLRENEKLNTNEEENDDVAVSLLSIMRSPVEMLKDALMMKKSHT